MNTLLATLFLSRDIAHKEHLATSSYAAHTALGGFYIEVIDIADKLAELYSGRTGERITNIPYYGNPSQSTVVELLGTILEQIQESRLEIMPDDSVVQSVFDDLEVLFSSTLYKLRFLK